MDASIDFGDLIRAAAAHYLPRPHLEAAVRQALDAGDAGMLVVRGEPGSGKTCLLAAQLAAAGGLHHFLRRGHTEYTLWRDPYGFLTSLGFQLKARFGERLFPSSVVVDVDQRVHMLAADASLTGIRIERLIAVPWTQAALRVRQDVQGFQGQAAALQVEELVQEYHRIPLGVFREMALIDPLRRLKTERPAERLVLWVDALDEEPPGEATIAGVLPDAQELQSLGNLQVVVASRPGQHLDRFLQAGAVLVDLSEAAFAADNRAFASACVQRALAEDGVRAAIAAAGEDPAALAEQVLARAGDNPLYIAQFFESVRGGDLRGMLQGGLPPGLDALQARLLSALATRHGGAFVGLLLPALQALAVARRPLTRAQLARFSSLSDEQAGAALRALQPYLDEIGAEPEATYALYQRSFQETLTAPAHRAEAWSVSAEAAHDRLSAAYWRDSAVNVEVLDDYGLDFLAAHLAAGGAASRARLLALPGREWRRIRRRAAGSHWPFLEDLRLALRAAQALPAAEAVPAVARLALSAGLVHDAERALPAGALGCMVRVGLLQRALGAVSPEMETGDQVARLAEIAAALAHPARSGTATSAPAELPGIYYQLLRQALDLLEREPLGFALADLLEACPLDASPAMREVLQQAEAIVRNLPADWRRPRAVIEIARLFAAIDRQAAASWFETALQDCLQQLRSSLTLEQARLMRYWAAFDAQAAAGVLPRLRLAADVYSVQAVLALGRALEVSGQAGALADLAGQAEEQLLAGQQDPYQRALSEAELGCARHETGDTPAALSALTRGRDAAAQIGGDQDPSKVQNRPSMGVDAWIAVGALAVDLSHADAQALLETAWTAYAQHGKFNADLRKLVDLQVRVEPGLLEVYLDQIAAYERGAAARLNAVEALLDAGLPAQQVLARRWLDQALESAESAVPLAWSGAFVQAAVLAAPPEAREESLHWVRDSLGAEEEVAFRLNALPRMAADDAQRRAWLAQTLHVWGDSVQNENVLSDLPAALLDLPEVLTTPWLANPPEIADPLKRWYLTMTLSALAERRTPGSGRDAFAKAHVAIPQVAGNRVPAAVLQAFGAGAWWMLDPARASDLWTRALAWLNVGERFAGDANQRHYWLIRLARELEAGAPEAALQVYLACPEPPLPPGTATLVVPGALVDPIVQAGLGERDYRLGLAAARSLSRGDSPLREAIPGLFPSASRALALAGAARSGSPARRLQQAEAALEAALQVEPPHLRWLLYAHGISAMSALGAHQRALERLRPAAQAILQALPVFGTLPMSGYAHALGRLAAALLAAGEAGEASSLLFAAARLGGEGVYRALAEVCGAVVAHGGTEGLQRLREEVERGSTLMGP